MLNLNLDLDFQIEQIIEKNEGLWRCKVCEKTDKQKSNIRQHAEIHIEGVVHTCHICSKSFQTRRSLHDHMSFKHSDQSFVCDICDKSGMTKMALRKHKANTHTKCFHKKIVLDY